MPLSTKIAIIIGAILTLGLLSFIAYQQIQLSHRQEAIEAHVIEQKQLVDNITRSLSAYTTGEDLNQFIKDSDLNLKAISDDLDKLHAELTSANAVTIKSNGYNGTNIATRPGTANPNPQVPTVNCNGQQIECPNADPYGYMKKSQVITLSEPFGNVSVPIGETMFSAWQEKPWGETIYPREYHVISVLGTDENQRNYVYNKAMITVNNNTYDLPITKAEVKQEYPEAKFSWWNPRLFVGADAGLDLTHMRGQITPSINLGLSSYGQFKKQPDFSILQVGLGYGTVTRKGQAVVMPFAYNIGKHFPFMNNLYVGPAVNIGFDGGLTVGGGFRTGL